MEASSKSAKLLVTSAPEDPLQLRAAQLCLTHTEKDRHHEDLCLYCVGQGYGVIARSGNHGGSGLGGL